MLIFNVKELMEARNISRYRLGKLTGWNQRRINAYFFNRLKIVTLEEIETLCEIFDCDISDLINLRKNK